MILFSEPLLFCREFPPPAARAGAWCHASPGGAAAAVEEPAGGPERKAGRSEPQRVVRAAAGAKVSRSATAWPPTAGSSPFALFQLIGWPGRRILPGEERESYERSDFWKCSSTSVRALAHSRTLLHACAPVHITELAHTAGRRVSYTPTTQAHSGIHGAAPQATHDPGGWKARFAERELEGNSLFSKLA